jgi:hypothetical protein
VHAGKSRFTAERKAYHSMAFKDFWLRKNLLFPDEEHTSVTSKKMAKRWSPESTLLFVRVLRIGYEISDWMVPVDPQANYFLKRG